MKLVLRVVMELLSFLRYRREMGEAKMRGPTFAKSGVGDNRHRARMEATRIAFHHRLWASRSSSMRFFREWVGVCTLGDCVVRYIR